MNWLEKLIERLFHEPRDVEVDIITRDLNIETERHYRESKRIENALADYDRAEDERLRNATS